MVSQLGRHPGRRRNVFLEEEEIKPSSFVGKKLHKCNKGQKMQMR